MNQFLKLNTYEVEASHFVTIGTYDEESLLYLNSLGIKENDAKKLLKKSFMLSIFDDNFKKEVTMNREDFPILKNDIIYFVMVQLL